MKRRKTIAHKRRRLNQGFALPIVLGIGLLLLLVGMTMVFRSFSDRQIATAQGATAQSLVVAETGINRIQGLLLQYPGLAANGLKNWSVEVAETPVQSSCNNQNSSPGNQPTNNPLTGNQPTGSPTPINQPANSPSPTGQVSLNSQSPSPSPTATPVEVSLEDEKTIDRITNNTPTDDWFDIGNDASQGQFKVLSYDVNGGFGRLKVQGKASELIRSANSSVQVDMPLEFPDPSPPGIWVSASADQPEPISVQADRSLKTNVWVEDTEDAVEIDDYPSSKMSCEKLEGGKCDTYKFRESGSPKPEPPKIPADSQIYENPSAHQLAGNQIAKGKAEVTLPKQGDKPDSDNKYRYLIKGDFTMSGESTININPPQGGKVVFYLEKNMLIGGKTKLNNTGSAENFEIYGSSSKQYYDDNNNTATTRVAISTPNLINAFIDVPEAEISIQGQASLKGAVWSKNFESTRTVGNVIVISETSCLQDLEIGKVDAGSQTAKVRPTKSWQRKPAL